ncbi:MAG: nicotinate-nucleotide adenylyltransferase [Ignavibacteria bacterium]
MKRYGVFGGAFNPVHMAHLIIAEDVRQQMHLDKVLFIPYSNPPHKNSEELLNAEYRLQMLRFAVEGNPFFEISDIEIHSALNSRTYTVDTLLKLRELYKPDGVKFYLIIGLDNLIELHTWKDPGKLFLLSEVVVLNRPGYFIQSVENEYNRRVVYIPAPNIDISASDIRNKIREKKSIKYLVPEKVEKFITENNLYKKD